MSEGQEIKSMKVEKILWANMFYYTINAYRRQLTYQRGNVMAKKGILLKFFATYNKKRKPS